MALDDLPNWTTLEDHSSDNQPRFRYDRSVVASPVTPETSVRDLLNQDTTPGTAKGQVHCVPSSAARLWW